MILYYEGTDITAYVNITRCLHRDASHGRADSLEIELDHADAWYRWGVNTDDRIRITHNGYDTGTLFISAVYPEGKKYKILATSLPGAARRKAWVVYRGKTLETIMKNCAAECGLEARIYGISPDLDYPFLLRKDEGCAAFLNRICGFEGAVLKVFSGAFRAIGVEYAQSLAASRNMHISTSQEGVTFTRRDNTKYSALTVATPYAQATARDAAAGGNNHPIVTGLPARSAAQAARFARSLLLMHNRKAETLRVNSTLDAGLTSMARVDISGNTGANGNWIIDEAEHDLVNETSTAKMLRAISI